MFSSGQISKLIQFFLLPVLFIDFLTLVLDKFYSLGPLNMLITTVLLPVYLIIKYNQVNHNRKNKSSLTDVLIMLVIVWFMILLDYIFWGLKSGLLFKPDGETIAIMYYLVAISSGIIIIGSSAGYIRRLIRK